MANVCNDGPTLTQRQANEPPLFKSLENVITH